MVRLSTIVPSALVAMACSVVMVLIANQLLPRRRPDRTMVRKNIVVIRVVTLEDQTLLRMHGD